MSQPSHEETDLEAEEDYEILTQPTSPSSSSLSSLSSSTLEPKIDSSTLRPSIPPSPSPWYDRTSTFTSLANQYGNMQSRIIKFSDGIVERRWFWVLDTHRGKPHPPTTLLLIHGIGGRVEHFVDQIVDVMNRVDEGHLRVIAMDLMGHGRSPKPRGSHHYHSDEFVADLEHIMSTSTSKHNLVMGHSLGAALAATLAVRSRFPISRLVLLGIPDLINKKKTLSLGARIFQLMMRNCWERVLIALRPLISKVVIAAAYHPTTSRDLIVAEAKCNSQNPFYVVRSVAEGAKLHDITATSFTRISCPTLLLHGATDGVCSPDASRTLAQYISHATLQIIPNTSHNLHIERPSEINPIIASFLFASIHDDEDEKYDGK